MAGFVELILIEAVDERGGVGGGGWNVGVGVGGGCGIELWNLVGVMSGFREIIQGFYED